MYADNLFMFVRSPGIARQLAKAVVDDWEEYGLIVGDNEFLAGNGDWPNSLDFTTERGTDVGIKKCNTMSIIGRQSGRMAT